MDKKVRKRKRTAPRKGTTPPLSELSPDGKWLCDTCHEWVAKEQFGRYAGRRSTQCRYCILRERQYQRWMGRGLSRAQAEAVVAIRERKEPFGPIAPMVTALWDECGACGKSHPTYGQFALCQECEDMIDAGVDETLISAVLRPRRGGRSGGYGIAHHKEHA